MIFLCRYAGCSASLLVTYATETGFSCEEAHMDSNLKKPDYKLENKGTDEPVQPPDQCLSCSLSGSIVVNLDPYKI